MRSFPLLPKGRWGDGGGVGGEEEEKKGRDEEEFLILVGELVGVGGRDKEEGKKFRGYGKGRGEGCVLKEGEGKDEEIKSMKERREKRGGFNKVEG